MVEGSEPQRDDVCCEHGVAMDVHCCGCHSGFLFNVNACSCIAIEIDRDWNVHGNDLEREIASSVIIDNSSAALPTAKRRHITSDLKEQIRTEIKFIDQCLLPCYDGSMTKEELDFTRGRREALEAVLKWANVKK